MAAAKNIGGIRESGAVGGAEEFTLHVPLEDAPDADESEDIGGDDDAPSRLEKKRARYDGQLKSAKEAAEEARRAAEEAKREAAELRRRLDEGAAPQPKLDDLYKQYRQKLNDEEVQLHERFRLREAQTKGVIPKEELKEFRDKQDDINERRAEAQHRYYQTKYQPQQGNDVEKVLAMEYPDLYDKSHPERRTWMLGVYNQHVSEGKPGDLQACRDIAERAMVQFRLKAKPVDDVTRARYSGRSAGSSGNVQPASVDIKMGKEQKQMAELAFPKLPKEKAWEAWAKGPGKMAALGGRRKSA